MYITRGSSKRDLTIASGAAITDAISMERHAGGSVLMPSAWTAANVGFKISDAESGTYYPLYDAEGSIVEIASPAASKAYAIPAEVFGAAYVKLWSQDGSGNDTNQAAARTVGIILKT